MSELYDHDFFSWTLQQASLLREGRVGEADLGLIAEEIEEIGRNRQQELRNRLTVLLLHLLKWEYQPDRRGQSWRSTIIEQRERIAEHLDDNPSLRPLLAESVERGYRYALQRVEVETGMDRTAFAAACPYGDGEVLSATFLPGPA